MNTYNINLVDGILKVGFGAPAQNDQIVRDAKARLDEMVKSGELAGGKVINRSRGQPHLRDRGGL
jgi:CRISPR-associated protein Csx3